MIINVFRKYFGPGIITGASDDDPSGIATYSQAGAMFGLATLWTAFSSRTYGFSSNQCHIL
ncbi:hypothetical protein EBV26_11505 [bacterium]|nr:hypothetical protein [bacterium]